METIITIFVIMPIGIVGIFSILIIHEKIYGHEGQISTYKPSVFRSIILVVIVFSWILFMFWLAGKIT